MSRSRIGSLFLSATLSLLAITYVAMHCDWTALRLAAHHMRWQWIPAIIAIYMTSHLLRGWRWKKMLAPIQHVSWRSSTEIVLMGYMANNVLPLRLGEFVRAFSLARSENIKKMTALSSIGVERILDGLTLLGCLAMSALGAKLAPEIASRFTIIGGGAAAMFCFAFLGVVAIKLFPVRVQSTLSAITRPFGPQLGSKLNRLVNSIIESFGCVRADANFLQIIALSLTIWITEGIVFWIGLYAFDLPPSWTLAFFTLAVVNLSILIPSAPGYVGVFQMGTMLAFSALGQDTDTAAAYAILIHLCQYLPVTLSGLAIMNWRGYKLAEMSKDPVVAGPGSELARAA